MKISGIKLQILSVSETKLPLYCYNVCGIVEIPSCSTLVDHAHRK